MSNVGEKGSWMLEVDLEAKRDQAFSKGCYSKKATVLWDVVVNFDYEFLLRFFRNVTKLSSATQV